MTREALMARCVSHAERLVRDMRQLNCRCMHHSFHDDLSMFVVTVTAVGFNKLLADSDISEPPQGSSHGTRQDTDAAA